MKLPGYWKDIVILIISTALLIVIFRKWEKSPSRNKIFPPPFRHRDMFDKIGQEFFTWRNENACKNRRIFGGKIYSYGTKKRLDGNKTLCMDEGVRPSYSCLVYSFGVNGEWSFEEEMEKIGCLVIAFDPSMSESGKKHSNNIWFFQTGLWFEDRHNNSRCWELKTFGTLLRNFDHSSSIIDVLKIDIEDAEEEVVLEMLESGVLENVKQLLIEVHKYGELYYGAYWLLEKSGFTRFESQLNPFSDLETQGDLIAEISWYNNRFLPGYRSEF